MFNTVNRFTCTDTFDSARPSHRFNPTARGSSLQGYEKIQLVVVSVTVEDSVDSPLWTIASKSGVEGLETNFTFSKS